MTVVRAEQFDVVVLVEALWMYRGAVEVDLASQVGLRQRRPARRGPNRFVTDEHDATTAKDPPTGGSRPPWRRPETRSGDHGERLPRARHLIFSCSFRGPTTLDEYCDSDVIGFTEVHPSGRRTPVGSGRRGREEERHSREEVRVRVPLARTPRIDMHM